MPPNLDVFQQVFALSLASNAVRYCEGPSEEIQKTLAAKLPSLIHTNINPDWQVVWGPAVWKHDKSTAEQPPDNVWFVAKHPSLTFEGGSEHCTYVVAIAATTGEDRKSYDWRYEDFAVGKVVDLLGWIGGKEGITARPVSARGFDKSKVWVANGTAKAVHTLANALPTGTGQSSLAEWLKALEPNTGARLIFTGHSLGGALSPTLAVTLSKAGYLKNFEAECTLAYPTAGASPGNDRFAHLFQDTFPPSGKSGTYQVWNQNVVNSLDIVPHAWCTDKSQDLNLQAINTIYGKLPKWGLIAKLYATVKYLCIIAGLSWVTYWPINHSTFHGEAPSPPKTMDEFENEAEKQHTNAYAKFILGSPNLPDPICPEKKHGCFGIPVLGAMHPHLSEMEDSGLFEEAE
ncbi:hypothetical protein BDV93DRAFT_547242 [Ceratobasidium sp. AG-I]|nr:hypothetical protein BDV93DRAFT_547242 [Ceratobasidium sp. AG-I]